MASVFAAIFGVGARSALFDLYGATHSYTPGAGEGSAGNVTAIVHPEDADLLDDETGRQRLRSRLVEVQTSEVASPKLGDTITISSEVWTVRELVSIDADAGIAALRVVRPVKLEDGGRKFP